MTENPTIGRLKRLGFGVAFIAFPTMLLLGFVMHPNFWSFEMVTDVQTWADEFRGSFVFHFGHLLVLLSVPPIIVAGLRSMQLATGRGAWYGFVGGVIGIFGAFILAVDKGALTLVLTAFDTLPDDQFEAIYPALQALMDQRGWLWIVRFLALLPIGFAVQTIGLARAEVISKGQAIMIVTGLMLLLSPDIEIISTAGAALLCAGYIPLGLRELREQLVHESVLAA